MICSNGGSEGLVLKIQMNPKGGDEGPHLVCGFCNISGKKGALALCFLFENKSCGFWESLVLLTPTSVTKSSLYCIYISSYIYLCIVILILLAGERLLPNLAYSLGQQEPCYQPAFLSWRNQ